MIQLPNHEERLEFKKAQAARLLSAYSNAPETKTARVLTKAEFVEEYPAELFEAYSLEKLDRFRHDIEKAEDVEDKVAAFKGATAGLIPLVVHGDGKQTIVFVRRKEKGE